MITANEAKQLRNEFFENREKQKQEDAWRWCREVADYQISKAAKEGGFGKQFTPPYRVISEIKEILEQQGFDVTIDESRLTVKWAENDMKW